MEQKTMILAVIGVIAVICAGVGGWFLLQDDGPSEEGDITVTDMRGRTVEVPGEVDSIVCISAGAVRMAVYMDAADMIVGVDDMDKGLKGPPVDSPRWSMATYRLVLDTSQLPCIGDHQNFKEIMETGADLIVTSETDVSDLDTLQRTTGIPVVAVRADGDINVDDSLFRENVELLGKVLGKEKRAEELISGIEGMVSDLRSKASKVVDRPEAYVGGMFFMMKGDMYTTTGNFIPFDLAGVSNVMPDKGGIPYDTNLKTLVESGAEHMFIDSINGKSSKQIFEADRATLQELEAVRDGNIHSLFTYKFYGTNWESELMNAYYIGSLVNPDVYGKDWKSKVDGVLELFYPGSGLDTDRVNQKQAPGASELDW